MGLAKAKKKIPKGKINRLLKTLESSSNPNRRRKAAETLGEIGDQRFVEPLMRALNDEGYGVKRGAAEALGKIGDGRAVEPLIRALNESHDVNVRLQAARALSKIGDGRVVEPLMRALNDEHYAVRSGAAEALGKIDDERVVEPLMRALNDENQFVRSGAAEALDRRGDRRAAEPLMQALSDEYKSVRYHAAKALGKIGDERALEPLIRALNDEYGYVRHYAVEALGKIGDGRAVEPLIRALNHKDDDVRERAIETLGNLGDRRAVEPLIQALDDYRSRYRANEALEKIGEKASTPVLISTLENQNKAVRRWAAEALLKREDRKGIEALNEFTGEDISKKYHGDIFDIIESPTAYENYMNIRYPLRPLIVSEVRENVRNALIRSQQTIQRIERTIDELTVKRNEIEKALSHHKTLTKIDQTISKYQQHLQQVKASSSMGMAKTYAFMIVRQKRKRDMTEKLWNVVNKLSSKSTALSYLKDDILETAHDLPKEADLMGTISIINTAMGEVHNVDAIMAEVTTIEDELKGLAIETDLTAQESAVDIEGLPADVRAEIEREMRE